MLYEICWSYVDEKQIFNFIHILDYDVELTIVLRSQYQRVYIFPLRFDSAKQIDSTAIISIIWIKK